MNQEELANLLNKKDFKNFINAHISDDVNNLRLKYANCSSAIKFAILQIECKNRIKKKLPEIYNSSSFLYPNVISTEQCTAQEIAEFHASLFNKNDKVLDLTAGLCIDTYFISKKVRHVTAIELNYEIASISTFNMNNLTDNVTVVHQDCSEYIKNTPEHFDVIFIDPARRGENNKRLYGMCDCQPNIVEMLPSLTHIADILYIKASPMIDISQSIRELNHYVTDVWVLGINNECKELLFKVNLSQRKTDTPKIHTINFETSSGYTQKLSSVNAIDNDTNNLFAPINIGSYLYEPNKCIMKAAIFDSLQATFNIRCIQHNSHLFVGTNLISDFPGRRFAISDIIPFKSKNLKNFKNIYPRINVSVRNFKMSADELKKKLKVNDGGDKYLFGTTDKDNNMILIICDKI